MTFGFARRTFIATFGATFGACALALSAGAAETKYDAVLKAAVADKARSPENTARDMYRRPYEALTFWGLKPGMTVIELDPASGYWTEILAPYAHASGGHYVAQMPDETGPKMSEQRKKSITAFKGRFADEAKFGKVTWVDYQESGTRPLGPPASADMIISARNMHDYMWEKGQLEKVLKDMYTVLKPGGILAVEDHRADPRPQVQDARDGYVNTAYMVAAVEKAGFKLEASSEIYANPKDTKDYPLGVWALPPTNATKRLGYMLDWPGLRPDAKLEPEKYKAIGESDRMTLRFRKP